MSKKSPRLTTLGNRVSSIGRLAGADKKGAPVYDSKEWRSFIARVIRERGRRCEDPACVTLNRAQGKIIYGDHIVELQDGGALLDRRNVMLRCAPCHGKKTADERAKRMGVR